MYKKYVKKYIQNLLIFGNVTFNVVKNIEYNIRLIVFL